MPMVRPIILAVFAALAFVVAIVAPAAAQPSVAIEDGFAEVNGIRLHYLAAGQGDPVVLLNG